MNNDLLLFGELAQLAAQKIGLCVPDNTHDRFIGILRELARHHGCATLLDYRNILASKQSDGEWEKIARAFTTGETFFFRDHGQIDLMRLRLLPELIAQHRSDKTLRLWSAGCASGEEVYSLAMLVDMLLPERDGWNILILGTDINSEAIAKAQRGYYGKWSFRMIPPELQQRYFHPDGNEWELEERIRRMVTFRISNLVDDPFPDAASELHNIDLILCRNVFIYFDSAAVFTVATKFSATLREGGYLLTAHTELMNHKVPTLESRLLTEGVVYQQRAQTSAPTTHRMQERETLPSTTTFQRAAGYPTPPPSPALRTREAALPLPPLVSPWSLRSSGKPAGMPLAGAGEVWPDLGLPKEDGGKFPPPIAPAWAVPPAPPAAIPAQRNDEALFEQARAHADRGEFDLAEQTCRKALAANPLGAAPYFLLAQLAQIKGDFNQAKDSLNKAIYLDSRFVAAYLELAALCERTGDLPRATTLRRAALGIARSMPKNEMIQQYETTAGDMTQWLTQWEHEPSKGA